MRAPQLFTVAIVGALVMALATVMVPDLTPAEKPEGEVGAPSAEADSAVETMPVLPASGFGDPYYDWARFTAPAARAARAQAASHRIDEDSRMTARRSNHTAPGR